MYVCVCIYIVIDVVLYFLNCIFDSLTSILDF